MENDDNKKLEQDQIIQIPKALLNLSSENISTTSDYCGSCEYEVQEQPCISGQNCCESSCLSCQNTCQIYCQTACEFGCQSSCESSCQDACEISSQKPKVRATIQITNIGTNKATINITRNDATQIHVVVREAYGSQTTVFDSGTISIVQSTATLQLTDLIPNTVYAYNLWDDVGGWIGLKTFTTESARPDNWVWTTSFYKGKKLPVHTTNHTYEILPATEWTSFQNRINEFREYTGLPQYGFTNVSRGTHFDNTIWNEAVYAICNMTDNSYQNIKKFEADDGAIINASMFQSIADELNSIP